MLDNEVVVYEQLKDWKYGAIYGAYEPQTDTIHILLSDADTMDRALSHERKHRARRNKPTFQLAQLFNTPLIRSAMLLAMLVTGFYALISFDTRPIASIFSVYFITGLAAVYEERKAK